MADEPREVSPVEFFDGEHRSNKAYGVTKDFRPGAVGSTINPDGVPVTSRLEERAANQTVNPPSGEEILQSTAEPEGEQLKLLDENLLPNPDAISEAHNEGAAPKVAAKD